MRDESQHNPEHASVRSQTHLSGGFGDCSVHSKESKAAESNPVEEGPFRPNDIDDSY